MKFLRIVVGVLLALLVTAPASLTEASSSKGPRAAVHSAKGAPASKTVHVRSYKRKDGTVVAAHTRAASRVRSSATGRRPAGSSRSRPTARSKATPITHRPSRSGQSVVVGRTATGRIARSEEAKRQFMRKTGYPHGRSGYVIDHVKPLACGGPDAPTNMQWQTIAEAKAKDKTERVRCQ
jgi:hypothetical protein